MTGLVRPDAATFSQAIEPLGWHPPGLFIEALWQSREILLTQLSVILPMGLFNLVGSLQNLESAEAAGDAYPTAPCLAANGVGSVVAAVCGSCFPTPSISAIRDRKRWALVSAIPGSTAW